MERHLSSVFRSSVWLVALACIVSASCGSSSAGSDATADDVTVVDVASSAVSVPVEKTAELDSRLDESGVTSPTSIDLPLATETTLGDAGSIAATTTSEPGVITEAEENLRFDFGEVKGVENISGTRVLSFDRFQVPDEATSSFMAGPTLQAEYLIGALTDWPFKNENTRLRRYPVAPSAQASITTQAWLAGQDEFCGGDGSLADVPMAFEPTVVEDGLNGHLTSLTFDDSGWVTGIRYMLTC